ncbi:MAG: anti-sigma factor [Rhizobiaceae bacterium]|nr:anti-sigma factor [Rhizobiaceae bacterium]
MNPRMYTENDIHLALDGEMPGDERAAYERWLDANPDMKARADRYAADRERLRRTLEPVLGQPVPPRLQQMLSQPGDRSQRLSWLARAAAAALIFVLGAAAGYGVGFVGRPSADAGTQAFVESALAAHRVYSAEKLHVVEVGADQRDHLVGWLSKRVGVAMAAPDLSPQGFRLIGGRLLPLGATGTAAQFMYEDVTGKRLSLYVTRQSGEEETGFRLETEGGVNALYWLDEGYGCVVAGDVPEAMLRGIADSAYRQLLQGPHA